MSRFSVRIFLVFQVFLFLTSVARAQITEVNNGTSTPIPGTGHDYIHMLGETVSPANVTITGGSQTVTVKPPVLPPGAIGYFLYRNDTSGGSARAQVNSCFLNAPGSVVVDTASFTCGTTPPQINSSLAETLGSSGVTGHRLQLTPTLFANLGAPANGSFVYCADCTVANPCAGSGTGAFAKRLAGIWVCN